MNDRQDPPPGFSVRHAGDDPFESEGLRAFFEYRDLGIKAATDGRFGAHVIRAKAGTGTVWSSEPSASRTSRPPALPTARSPAGLQAKAWITPSTATAPPARSSVPS